VPLTLGTAGHIDHGKTRLVEALTGTNTDRLPEEQARGISIELGYAPLELPSGRRLSVIDVPGHERFVRTMVAGATGIDLFLLVVDAGEGPRPQTHEHLRILKLLGVEHGVVALTKIDAVEHVHDVAELVSGAEIVRVSSVTGEGLDELRAALDRAAAAVGSRERGGKTRLYVDRVFSLPGAGTVVTGTLWSGQVGAGDRLEVQPGGFEARVRSVQVHGEAVERAEAGQRVAVALTPERRRRVARGDALVAPGAFPVSFRLDVELDGDVEDGARVHVCHGTTSVPARVVRAGEYAQLRLDRPLVAARGDRVVLWRETTVGGGIVLDPAPPRHADAARVGKTSVSSPVREAELRLRGLDVDGLERAGAWVFSLEWLDELRERAYAALAARGGLPATALVGDVPWSADVIPLLGLDRAGGRLYLPGQQPVEPTTDELKLGDGSVIPREEYERAKALLIEECERAGRITLARFRDLLGESRRVAQLLLERFDSDRITLRVGDERRLRRSAARH
jgi:selenocysteine-specific elongation factor